MRCSSKAELSSLKRQIAVERVFIQSRFTELGVSLERQKENGIKYFINEAKFLQIKRKCQKSGIVFALSSLIVCVGGIALLDTSLPILGLGLLLGGVLAIFSWFDTADQIQKESVGIGRGVFQFEPFDPDLKPQFRQLMNLSIWIVKAQEKLEKYQFDHGDMWDRANAQHQRYVAYIQFVAENMGLLLYSMRYRPAEDGTWQAAHRSLLETLNQILKDARNEKM